MPAEPGRMVEARVVVTGRVQGVWFRGSTQEFALRCGVRGWVRNLPDRSVEAVLQGDREAVDRVIAFMRKGPPGAVVTDIRVDERPPAEHHDGFSIRH